MSEFKASLILVYSDSRLTRAIQRDPISKGKKDKEKIKKGNNSIHRFRMAITIFQGTLNLYFP